MAVLADDTYSGAVKPVRTEFVLAPTIDCTERPQATIELPVSEGPVPVAASYAGSSTREYADLGRERWLVGSASHLLNDRPLWQGYLEKRLSDLAAKTREPGYPRGDIFARVWSFAFSHLRTDSPTPSVVPGEDSSIELVWKRAGWHVEIEISKQEDHLWAIKRDSGECYSGSFLEHRGLFLDVLAVMSE